MQINLIKNIKGLAFDLDGTLVDSLPGLASAVSLAMQSMDFPPVTKEQVGIWVGNGADVLMTRALTDSGNLVTPALIKQLHQRFDHYYKQTVESGSVLYSGVLATLESLKKHQLPMVVVTNKASQFVSPLLESLGIGSYFSLVVGGDDVTERKPHPAPIYLVLAKLGLHASELLFVGDSRNDIQAAHAAGCPSVGLSYGYNYGEPIALSEPTQVLDQFIDILPLIGLSK